jgi:formate hydrogenlyase subunit 3/multisubunit Na+/H+ antiporter MnhD subunit
MTMTAEMGSTYAVALILAPLLAAALGVALPRSAPTIGIACGLVVLGASLGLASAVLGNGAVALKLGAWAPPLGIALQADGFTVVMLVMTGAVGSAISLTVVGADPARPGAPFWPLWMLLLAGMNGVYLSGDAFNLYVALEIVGLAAVGLTVLSGKAAALRAGLGYLFAGLLGSLLFLLGMDFLYAGYGRVDLAGIAAAARSDAPTAAALVLMTAGLLLKTALFPLHFWLPAAHSNALPAASALLSGLVVKASLYLVLRLWLDVFAPGAALATLVGLLGVGAMLWGSIQALRADRLKLLVAYSTVAQIGLMVVAFGLTGTMGFETAWRGAVMLMLAHAAAKAAMFLAVGRIAEEMGHDRIAGLDRAAVRPGMPQAAFALAAVSLIGLPPSGGFVGKWLLLEGTLASGGWFWTGAIVAGTALSIGYLVRVLARFLRFDRAAGPVAIVPAFSLADLVPLGLALCAVLLGLAAAAPLAVLGGAP